MRTRIGAALTAALLLPLLTACFAPAPAPTPTAEPDPVSIEGGWVATRTLVDTTVTNEGLEVGLVETRLLDFSDTTCEDGVCTGTVRSALSDSEEDQANALETDFTWDGEALTFTAAATTDCTYTDGTVAHADAFVIDTTYDLTVGEGDEEGVTSFTGTVESVISTTDEALATGCPESAGVRSYEVEVLGG